MDSEFCMKCGRELKESQVFCNECLEEMERYPVKPGIVVLLPKPQSNAPKAASRRKHPQLSPEEQIHRLKQRTRRLTVALIMAVALALTAGWLVVSQYLRSQEVKILPGQNYSSAEPLESEQNP